MNQNPLFTEDFLTALDDVVRAVGTYQQVAGRLWPCQKTAYNRLKNKLNPDHHEQFHPDEVIGLLKIGRDIGCHTAIYHLCDEAGYERPREAAPKSPRTVILERQAELASEQARLQRDLDRIDTADMLKAVK